MQQHSGMSRPGQVTVAEYIFVGKFLRSAFECEKNTKLKNTTIAKAVFTVKTKILQISNTIHSKTQRRFLGFEQQIRVIRISDMR